MMPFLLLVNLEWIAPAEQPVLDDKVGLSGLGRSLQKDLNQIAEVADTSTMKGLSSMLQDTTSALIRHRDYCISAYSSADGKRNTDECEIHFDQLSIEERAKLDEETLVNVDNVKRKSSMKQRETNGLSNEYIVVTILVAVDGDLQLPSITGSENLKESLQKLGSIPSHRLLAVEVLWTPQDENDILSEQEYLEKYPLLQLL